MIHRVSTAAWPTARLQLTRRGPTTGAARSKPRGAGTPRAAFTLVTVSMAVMVSGCASQSSSGPTPYRGDPRFDTGRDVYDLRRALEATVLENFGQLTLGNFEAYADGIARQQDIALIGLAPDALVVGERTLRSYDPRPYGGDGVRLLARNLDVHLATDGSVGWVFDESSLRVPHEGREAAIPLRITSVFVRDVDRWVVAVEHVSYPLPMAEILELARQGALPAPARMETVPGPRDLDARLRELIVRTANATDSDTAELLAVAERRASDTTMLGPSEWVSVFPDREHERRGEAIYGGPSLAALLGEQARIELAGYRLSVARSRRVAWIAANLRCAQAGPAGDVAFGLRGTFVFELDALGWAMVQSHISVPVTRDFLDARAFGPP